MSATTPIPLDAVAVANDSPLDAAGAEVDVVTRENGSVTGQYEFRLVRVCGDSEGTDDALGDVDDCWMTDAVAASTE